MNRALLDTDVVLDKILDRKPWADEETALWEAIRTRRLEAFIGAITPLNVAYIARRSLTPHQTLAALEDLMKVASVVPVDAPILRAALTSPITDYEDAVQHECALAIGADVIITRNVRDFAIATLPVYAPAAFIAKFLAPANGGEAAADEDAAE